MDDRENSRWAGKFIIPPDGEVYGELTLAGPTTSLYLHDDEHFSTHNIPGQHIEGVLHDLTKVSLIQCVTVSGTGSGRKGEDTYHFATVFPHFVVYGDSHIAPDQKTITEVYFTMDDASALFYDFDAFSFLIDARPFIETLANANALPRKVVTGPDPIVAYFTGKTEILATETVLGKVSVSHRPSHNFGGPNGVRLTNTIFVRIQFKEPLAFADAIAHGSTLLRYFGMLVGRPQNLLGLTVRIDSNQDRPVLLRVYCSMSPRPARSDEEQKPHPADVLLDAVGEPEVFSQVLGAWLNREESWRDARLRFFYSFAQKNHYYPDRLVASANMFDILPSSAVPSETALSEELKTTKECARSAFARLPRSLERDSVLNALGRLGKSSLKQKIGHRAQQVVKAVPERFPDLLIVTDQAVNCRNYYVHGGDRSFDYSANFDAVTFFIDALEFVFAASDLIEAGWNLKSWSDIPTSMSHPFGRFRVDYPARLSHLKALLAAK